MSHFDEGPTSHSALSTLPIMTADRVLITKGDGAPDVGASTYYSIRVGVHDWGGFLLLDERGKIVRKLKRRSQGELSIDALRERITAREWVDITGWKRKRLRTAFPGTFGFWAYRSGLWLGLMIAALFFAALIVVCLAALIVNVIAQFS